MSGSSLDGLDIAFVELEEQGGKWNYHVLNASSLPYDSDWQQKLQHAPELSARAIVELDAAYGKYIGQKVNEFIASNGIEYKVGLVVSHGHTVFHHPPHYTTQIGNGAFIAATTSLPVVSDLRTMDIAMGGQGAPIVPMGEFLLYSAYKYFLNIGGIANLSFRGEKVYDAFDVCPANRVLNMLASELGKTFDENGDLSRKGKVIGVLLDQLNALEYYWQAYPKSLANEFGTEVIYPLIQSFKLNPHDALCTYVEHISMQTAEALQQVNRKRGVHPASEKIMITGGGALNTFLIERLQYYLDPLSIHVGVPDKQTVEFKEAIVMALLGVLRWREEATVIQTVTGATTATIGGALWMGKQ
jgi:anhydro-N-acetylmuramic acid kinase